MAKRKQIDHGKSGESTPHQKMALHPLDVQRKSAERIDSPQSVRAALSRAWDYAAPPLVRQLNVTLPSELCSNMGTSFIYETSVEATRIA